MSEFFGSSHWWHASSLVNITLNYYLLTFYTRDADINRLFDWFCLILLWEYIISFQRSTLLTRLTSVGNVAFKMIQPDSDYLSYEQISTIQYIYYLIHLFLCFNPFPYLILLLKDYNWSLGRYWCFFFSYVMFFMWAENEEHDRQEEMNININSTLLIVCHSLHVSWKRNMMRKYDSYL